MMRRPSQGAPSESQESHELQTILGVLNLAQREEIYEITYAYKKSSQGVINMSVFGTLGNIDADQSKIALHQAYTQTKSILMDTISAVGVYLKGANEGVEYDAIVEYQTILKFTLAGLGLELIKTGEFTESDLKELEGTSWSIHSSLNEVAKYDAILFGEKVINSPDELAYSNEFIEDELKQIREQGLLTQEELKKYISYVRSFQDKVGIGIEYGDGKVQEKLERKEALLEQVTGTMSRKDYIKVFKTFLKICGINKTVRINDNLSSVFDSRESLQIPGNDGYASKDKKRVLKMCLHEIETHFYTEYNHNMKYFVRGAGYLKSEEGLAQGVELLFAGKSFEEIGYTLSLPSIAVGEVLPGEDYKNYLLLRGKGLGYTSDQERTFLRRKRGYSNDLPGVQHKDTSYSRGIRENKQYILEGNDYKDFYLGKLSLEDLNDAKKKEAQMGLERKIPKLITEVLLKKLIEGKGSVQDAIFKEYIAQKYPFLKKKDIQSSGTLSMQQKRDLVEILTLFRK